MQGPGKGLIMSLSKDQKARPGPYTKKAAAGPLERKASDSQLSRRSSAESIVPGQQGS